MPTLDVRRTFDDDSFSARQDIDNILDDIETFLNVTRLDDDNIQDASITASDKISANSIPAGKLAANSVTTVKITDDSVTAAKLASDTAGSGITQDTDGSLAVNVDDSTLEISSDTVQVKDGGVVTAKINDEAVTNAKLASGIEFDKVTRNLQSDLAQATAAAASVSITTSGSPVFISFWGNVFGGSQTLALKRDSTTLFTYQNTTPLAKAWIDNVAAGTYTYSVTLTGSSTTNTDCHIQVVEL